jgi:hypothetical protein
MPSSLCPNAQKVDLQKHLQPLSFQQTQTQTQTQVTFLDYHNMRKED